jgi:ABC-type arginine/histidine transport system permease subunit
MSIPLMHRKMGFETAFMQGLCSFGFACRMAISLLIPGEPERMTRMAAQMTSVLFPDTPIKLQLWKIGDGVAYFRLMNLKTNKAVLNRGVFEWK